MKATSVMNAIGPARRRASRMRSVKCQDEKLVRGWHEYGHGRSEKTTLHLGLAQRYETVTRRRTDRASDWCAYVAGAQMVRLGERWSCARTQHHHRQLRKTKGLRRVRRPFHIRVSKRSRSSLQLRVFSTAFNTTSLPSRRTEMRTASPGFLLRSASVIPCKSAIASSSNLMMMSPALRPA